MEIRSGEEIHTLVGHLEDRYRLNVMRGDAHLWNSINRSYATWARGFSTNDLC